MLKSHNLKTNSCKKDDNSHQIPMSKDQTCNTSFREQNNEKRFDQNNRRGRTFEKYTPTNVPLPEILTNTEGTDLLKTLNKLHQDSNR